MRRHPLATALLLPLLAACGEIEVKTSRVGGAVPADLLGEWRGLWQSTTGSATGGGEVVLRVQSFEDEPVVAVLIDNPCLLPRDYQLVATATTFELRADGEPVFAAALGAGRVLTGTFHCASDAGAWHASWQRQLPVVEDLRGDWTGTVLTASAPSTPLVLQLDQRVRGGTIVLEGSLLLPELLPVALPVLGSVRFAEGSFDLVLGTPLGVEPSVQLAGIGESRNLVVENGILQASADPRLPFGQAVWRVQWNGR